ncbi:ABC transporter permease [Cellulophaga sp. F20128]|uniref:ABC transporter permease n=1 Tax=Cellulophaga sp. F20128 TaxID=2926413 RepID=UPI001FF201E2|nr:ABC transporter permease [Cellulophaga sp. F20128]MCK0157513.1 ABC transporter permease [Cellulophaga sp. F20128]
MHKLYLKIAIRYLLKNKLYSFINIAGLAIGIASFVLIMRYINYENSYDTFEGSENVQRVYMDALEGESFVASDAQTANLIGPTLKREFPEVLEQVRLYRFDKVTFKFNDKIFEESHGSLADATYFDVFKYPLLSGHTETALKDPYTIVLTESFAKKIFGTENPIKQTITAFYEGDKALLTVTGILKDIPSNTHMKTKFLISMETYNTWFANKEEAEPNWGHCNFFTYLKLDKNVNSALLKSKVIAADFEDDPDERYNIEPLEDIHLYSNKPYEAETNGSISRIKFLTAIAFIILILSWLNYINLSTTKSLERAKEVGIRKVAGAHKAQLVVQSFIESIVINTIAIALAVLIITAVFSLFESLTGNEMELDYASIAQSLPSLGFVILGIIVVGLYPAFLLSSYSPVKALKGKVRASASGLNIRKGFIIAQFLGTIVLIIGAIVVSKQINFIQNQPIGVNLNSTVAFQSEFLTEMPDSLVRSKYKILEGELENLPFVKKVSRAKTFPGDGYDNLNSFIGLQYPNGTEDNTKVFYSYSVQPNYFDVLDIKFLAGDTFIENAEGRSRTIIINEKCMQEMGITSPEEAINKTVRYWGIDWLIAGVIENYHHFGLKKEVIPIQIRHDNSSNNVLVKFDESMIATSGYSETLIQIENKWKQIFPAATFNYVFLDKKFEAQYNDDKTFGKAFGIFTMIAIFIACLGLFGLTSYSCVQRKKEIGIRKVNGATISQILSLLNKDFLGWVAIAFVLAIPVSWYAMNNWLSNFAYKTTLSWWIFVLAGLFVLGVAIITVSWQSFRAATSNPVEALRDE